MFEQRYELLEVLGRGGFAIVFRARDNAMSRDVAIKVLVPTDGPKTDTVRQRFLREAAVFAGLEDPHTITMYDFGESGGGLLYMVFEYVRSEALSDVIRGRESLHPSIVVHILIQLAGALREAHHKGIYHRDIKPANVLVYQYGDDPYRVKLIDFGIAKDANPDVASLTRTGRIVGTPRYMAPEQLFGQPMGPDSDIYSLGLVGFEMLAGRPAVQGGTNKQILKRQVSPEDFVIPAELAPPGLQRVLQRMLRKERRARYQSSSKVLEDLRLVMPQARAWVAEDAIDTIVQDEEPTLETDDPGPRSRPAGGRTPLATDSMSGQHISQTLRWELVVALAVVVLGLGLTLYAVNRPDAPPALPTATPRSNVGAILVSEPAQGGVKAETPVVDVGATDAPSEQATGCGTAHEPGLQEFRYGRAARGWNVVVPDGYDADQPHPVLLMFHRSWLGGKRMLRDTELRKTADAEGVILVSFSSEDSLPWQDKRDIEFTLRALQSVRHEFCVDYSRLYALGDGAGGGFVERLACSLPLSALVTTAYGMWDGDKLCEPSTPTPRLRIYGLLDKHVPVDGGGGCVPLTGPYVAASEIQRTWKRLYRCEEEPSRWNDYPGGECQAWTCESAAMLECETTGGHYWSTAELPALDLPTCDTDDPKPRFPYRTVVWDFFEQEGRVLNESDLETQRKLMDW